MKKILALFIAIIMAVSAMTLAGCSDSKSDKELIVGSWEGELNIQKALSGILADDSMAKQLDLSTAVFGITFTFDAEGKVNAKLDQDDVKVFVDSVCDQFIVLTKKQIETQTGVSYEEALKAANKTDADIMAEIKPIIDTLRTSLNETLASDFFSGTYSLEDGKLLTNGKENFEYKISSDKLTFTKVLSDSDTVDIFNEDNMPLVLKKVK